MFTIDTAAPAAVATSGTLLAVTIAVNLLAAFVVNRSVAKSQGAR